MSARIRPGDRREVGLATWLFARGAGLTLRTAPPALFLTLGRHRSLFRGWLHFAGKLMPGGILPRRITELLILRVAHQKGCAYEFEHHRKLGRRAGITPEEVDRIVAGPEAEGWSERERALLRATDQLVADGDLDDAHWAALRRHITERAAIEFCMVVGHYSMLATVITTLRIEPDPPSRLGRRPRS
ncbi:carboxymuconolactone decarboxylase family protein [Streptomyces sp. NPDC005438]|uniref:carboxymuconolactone decarboxylase family protein n=1 Tax=Streptomyces sp. NPDC005438 TaxID=3156880 RepID=UPI0033A85BFB